MKRKTIKMISIIVLIVLLMLLQAFCDKNQLMSYNLMDVLTFGIASIGIYYITKLNDDKRRRNEKIELVIKDIVITLNKLLFELPEQSKYNEYLYTFKYISNKITVLEKLTIEEKYDKYITEVRQYFDKIRDFVTDNINQSKEYFEDKKDKIPNLIINIENSLDKIIIEMYEDT